MIYLTAQPNLPYFIWQLRIQLSNFKRVGIDLKQVYILLGYTKNNQECIDFIAEFRDITNISCIFDNRENKTYSPSIRHFLISKFLRNNPTFQQEDIFLIDSDVLFVKLPNYNKLLKNNNSCFLADTKHYLGVEYISSKGKFVLQEMAKIVGIDKQIILNNRNCVGGAQYIFRGITPEFWDDVYIKSIKLFEFLKTDNQNNPPIQSWCADMWVILWKMYLEYDVVLAKELNFSWATDQISNLKNAPLFHNAGVVDNSKPNQLFFKGNYISKNPLNENYDSFEKKFCSYYYVEEIKKLQRNF